MTATATKTSPENITLFHLCYFAIISTRSTSRETANYSGRSGLQVKTENKTFTVVCSRSPKYLEFGHFTLLFCRGQQRNVPKCKTHVQSNCFCSFKPIVLWRCHCHRCHHCLSSLLSKSHLNLGEHKRKLSLIH